MGNRNFWVGKGRIERGFGQTRTSLIHKPRIIRKNCNTKKCESYNRTLFLQSFFFFLNYQGFRSSLTQTCFFFLSSTQKAWLNLSNTPFSYAIITVSDFPDYRDFPEPTSKNGFYIRILQMTIHTIKWWKTFFFWLFINDNNTIYMYPIYVNILYISLF